MEMTARLSELCVNHNRYIQESLDNAKVSARQPWYRYVGQKSLNHPSLRNDQQYQRNLYIV